MSAAAPAVLDRGSKVWYRQDDKTWLLADVLNRNGGRTLTVQLPDGRTLDVDQQQIEPANPAVQDAIHDLTQLSYLNEPSILNNLLLRYDQNVIYTKAGPVLIAVNPCQGLPLYGGDVAEQYKAGCLAASTPLEPHIYDAAGSAFRDMLRLDNSQSIVINGESGAGKTETAKKAMQFLASLAGGTGVDQQVLETNPILEAFGNAKTQRNPNSSRFGKLIEIHFNNSNQICGAKIKTYLLEKSRVVHQLPDERSFHIFYQLMKGVTDAATRQELKLPDNITDFRYLNKTGCTEIPGVDDAADFAEVLHALSDIGMDYYTDIKPLMATLSGILWLGNLKIETSPDDSSQVAGDAALNNAAALLGVNALQLAHAITHKKITAGVETIIKQLSPAEAIDARDALAKSLYAGVFEKVVTAINAKLDVGRLASGRFIAILDIYGFEHFKTNSFEQLCINYANERLQQQFTHHLFTQEQELYEEEGIDWSKIDWLDNQASLDVIETNPRTGPGLLSVLNTLCKIASSTDDKFMTELRNNLCDNECWVYKPHKPDEFVIRHYAADVAYKVAGFLDKNRDTLNQDLIDLMCSSSMPLIASIGHSAATPQIETRHSARTSHQPRPSSQTVGSKFTSQLQDLVSMLDTTGLHFVRCIKPNPTLRPGTFAADMILQQLRCCGVLEVARVAQAGFPTRYKYRDFVERYRVMLPVELRGLGSGVDDEGFRAAAQQLLSVFGVPAGDYELGSTTIFFKTGVLGRVEDRWARMQASALHIQSTWRMYEVQKQYKELRQAAVTVQSCWRARADRLEVHREQKAAVMIQRWYRSCVARQKILHAIQLVREAHRAGEIDSGLSQRIESQVATAGAIDDLMLQYGVFDMSEVKAALECYSTLKDRPVGPVAKGTAAVQQALQLLATVRAAAAGQALTPQQLEQQLKVAAFCQQRLGPSVGEPQLQELFETAASAEDAKAYAASLEQQARLREQAMASNKYRESALGIVPGHSVDSLSSRDSDVLRAASTAVEQQESDVSYHAQPDQADKKPRKGGLFSRAKDKVGRLTGQSSLKPQATQQSAAGLAPAHGSLSTQKPPAGPPSQALKAAQASNIKLQDEVAFLQKQLEREKAARMKFAKQQEQIALEWNSQVKVLESYIRSLQSELAALTGSAAAETGGAGSA